MCFDSDHIDHWRSRDEMMTALCLIERINNENCLIETRCLEYGKKEVEDNCREFSSCFVPLED